MASICHAPIGGRTIRATRLTTLGVPVTGAGAMVVSAGWTTVGMSDDVDTPTEWQVRTGAASTCVTTRVRPQLNWVDVDISFCRVDPDLLNLVTGATAVVDAAGASAGWAADTTTYAAASFSLELWTGMAGADACAATGARYGYLLLPWLTGGVHGNVTHGRGTVTFQVSATTQVGNQWGVGRHNVVRNGAGAAVPLLTAIPATCHRHWQVTTVAPPAGVCGFQAVA
jgi:hypothetical protein